jgi:Subtilase family
MMKNEKSWPAVVGYLLVLTYLPGPRHLVLAADNNNNNNNNDPSSLVPMVCSNWWNDTTCPWRLDGECDRDLSPLCATGDCWDCDPLQAYFYDCPTCLAAQGYWCPGDAICRGHPVDDSYLADQQQGEEETTRMLILTSCPNASDWKQSSCNVPIHDDNVYTDPLYDSMKWMYDMINVESVWRLGITGAGVHVRINDEDGVDATHFEFVSRFNVDQSCTNYLPPDMDKNHGTACASILGAESQNDHCAVGIAPGVTLSACTIPHPLINNEGALAFVHMLDAVDISSNSWGPYPCYPLQQRRQLQEETIPCRFEYDHDISPCRICVQDDAYDDHNIDNNNNSKSMNLTDKSCRQSIIYHCTNFYESDSIACAEYLDLFVDCQYHALTPTEHQLFVRAITEGRNGKGVIFSEYSTELNCRQV